MFLSSVLKKGKTRLVSIVTILVAVAMPIVFTTVSASADSLCNYGSGSGYCMQTNGGGVYTCKNNGSSCYAFADEWEVDNAGGGYAEIVSQGSGGCVGDYGNNSGNASAGLDTCPSQGTAGWGTKFVYDNCSNALGYGYSFINYHWSAWLGPQSFTNGVSEYLNKPNTYCFADGA